MAHWLHEELDELGPGLRAFVEASIPARSHVHAACARCAANGSDCRAGRDRDGARPAGRLSESAPSRTLAPASEDAGSGAARMRKLRSSVSSRPELVEILLAGMRTKGLPRSPPGQMLIQVRMRITSPSKDSGAGVGWLIDDKVAKARSSRSGDRVQQAVSATAPALRRPGLPRARTSGGGAALCGAGRRSFAMTPTRCFTRYRRHTAVEWARSPRSVM